MQMSFPAYIAVADNAFFPHICCYVVIHVWYYCIVLDIFNSMNVNKLGNLYHSQLKLADHLCYSSLTLFILATFITLNNPLHPSLVKILKFARNIFYPCWADPAEGLSAEGREAFAGWKGADARPGCGSALKPGVLSIFCLRSSVALRRLSSSLGSLVLTSTSDLFTLAALALVSGMLWVFLKCSLNFSRASILWTLQLL